MYRAGVIIASLLFLTSSCSQSDHSHPSPFSSSQTNPSNPSGEYCFCQLKGKVDDCSCSVDTVDYFNNVNVYPRLQSLTEQDYFRYYMANFRRPCPFWTDDSKCSIKDCHVKACPYDGIPEGLKSKPAAKYLEEANKNGGSDCDDELGFLDTTLSEAKREALVSWNAYDKEAGSFCDVGDQVEEDSEFVDLLLNPERFTGYRGPSAHRIWRSIYEENCFKPDEPTSNPFEALKGMCLEKRAFYRAVSGLHTSINVHLCAKFLMSEKMPHLGLSSQEGTMWGPNLEEFRKRFDPDLTDGYGPQRLKNLYFIYLLELRALAKAAPYLEKEKFYTGKAEEDESTRAAVKDLLQVIQSFPEHFNEKSMFTDEAYSGQLKEQFRLHFLNITRIMDCVGCDKCKLWGKLQTQGLGTALKILFTPDEDIVPLPSATGAPSQVPKFKLRRNEIVALFNAFARLSSSIHHIEMFRSMMR